MADLEKLRDIGAHKIYEQTHIAKRFAEDILNEKFSTMNKVQFTGFLSILEREYGVDLHELMEAYIAQHVQEESNAAPFVVSVQENEKKENNKALYIALLVVLLAVLIFIYNSDTPSPEIEEVSLPVVEVQTPLVDSEFNNTAIEEAKVNLDQMGNASKRVEPLVQKKAAELEITIEPTHLSKFEVNPSSKLWIGIIDLETFERTQKLSSDSFDLDPEKEWILVMGHGYVTFNVNGEEKKFTDKNKVWFAYEKGVLTKLKRQEFKDKNRGKAW